MSDMITAEERLYPHKQMWRLTDKFRPLLQAYGRVWEKQASLIGERGGSPREALDEEVGEVEAPIIAAIAEIETALHAQLADAKAAQAMAVERAAEAAGNAAVEALLRRKPEAGPLQIQMTRQNVRLPVLALADTDGNALVQALREERDALTNWRDDPESNEAWCAGNQYALDRLCNVLCVDPHKVSWDGSDGCLDEEADALIWRILHANDDEEGRSPAEADRDRLAAANAALEAQVARLVGAAAKDARDVFSDHKYAKDAINYMEQLIYSALAKVQADARREGGE